MASFFHYVLTIDNLVLRFPYFFEQKTMQMPTHTKYEP